MCHTSLLLLQCHTSLLLLTCHVSLLSHTPVPCSSSHTAPLGNGDAGYTNVGEEGNDISDTDPDCSTARPFYPSNSAYVVSVSSTYFSSRSTPYCMQAQDSTRGFVIPPCTLLREVPCSYKLIPHYTTGGGFSNIRPRQVRGLGFRV